MQTGSDGSFVKMAKKLPSLCFPLNKHGFVFCGKDTIDVTSSSEFSINTFESD